MDDIHSLPDSLRLVVQFTAMTMILWPVCIGTSFPLWLQVLILIAALIVSVGATNIFNFMDNIRPSNTEPYLRFICEATSEELLAKKVAETRALLVEKFDAK